MNGLCRPI
jgi:hypothetical protein